MSIDPSVEGDDDFVQHVIDQGAYMKYDEDEENKEQDQE